MHIKSILGVLAGFVFALSASTALAQTEASVALSGSVKVTTQAPAQTAGVRFYVDGTPFGSEDFYAPYEATLNTVSVSNGSHSIAAVVRSASGGYATSSPLTVTTYNKKTASVALSSSQFHQFEGGTITRRGASITAKVSGTAVGPAHYYFYCNSTDASTNTSVTPSKEYAGMNIATQSHACEYPSAGTYYPKVIIERDGAVSQSRGSVVITAITPVLKFSRGDTVQVTYTVNVRREPSLSGAFLGTQAIGGKGIVSEGPVYADRYWWWRIDYQNGFDGWSSDGYLKKVSAASTPIPTPGTTSDVTPPVISGITTANPNHDLSFMSITWTTNEPADGQVEFGTAPCPCANNTPVVVEKTTSHTINLYGLSSTTPTYYYRVKSKDAAGNLATSATQTFSNASSPQGSNVAPTLELTANPNPVPSGGAVVLKWSTTNVTSCSSSATNWFTNSWAGSNPPLSSTGISASVPTTSATTTVSFILTCQGAGGSVTKTASVAVTPIAAPRIINPPQTSNTGNPFYTTIVWVTDQLSTSQVEFGTAPCPCSSTSPLMSGLVTSHVVSLYNLDPTLTYYYRVTSKNREGAAVVSETKSFSNASLLTMDTDTDGFADYLESSIGTDATLSCGANAWPPDFDDNKTVNILDVLTVTGSVSPAAYNKRRDLNTDGAVTQADIDVVANQYYGRTCSL